MKLWPESKVLALMEIAFHYGCLYARKHTGKKRNYLWLAFKIDKLANNLKYVNPDRRCGHPVNFDVIDYCWSYAEKIDKGEEIDMNELCNGCEYLSVEAKNGLHQELSWVLKIYSSGKINDLIFDGLLLFAHDEEIKAIREKWQRKEINEVGLFHELEKLAQVESLPE